MRTVLAFALVGSLLAEPPCFAAQKIRIEIVEATRNVAVTGGPKPGSPETKETHCKTVEAGGAATMTAATTTTATPTPTTTATATTATTPPASKSQDCTTVTTPAVPASGSPVQMAVYFSAKIILPHGNHALVSCVEGSDGCGDIESAAPERTKQTWVGASKTTTGLGMFEAKRNKNEIVIYTPNGKRKYQIIGSW